MITEYLHINNGGLSFSYDNLIFTIEYSFHGNSVIINFKLNNDELKNLIEIAIQNKTGKYKISNDVDVKIELVDEDDEFPYYISIYSENGKINLSYIDDIDKYMKFLNDFKLKL